MLLLDNNLPHQLCRVFEGDFQGISHVRKLGLKDLADDDIWQFAREKGFSILTKDDDFKRLFDHFGHPPKVIWLRCGNKTTAELAALLEKRTADIHHFLGAPEFGLLEIF